MRFEELCKLCKIFGMRKREGKKRKGKGSHIVFRYQESPSYTLSIQNNDGKAVPYQVNQLLTWAEKMGFLKEYLKKEENNV